MNGSGDSIALNWSIPLPSGRCAIPITIPDTNSLSSPRGLPWLSPTRLIVECAISIHGPACFISPWCCDASGCHAVPEASRVAG